MLKIIGQKKKKPKKDKMAITLNLSIDVPSVAELNDFVYGLGYKDTIDGSPNPQTKGQFAKQMIIAYIRSIIKFKRVTDAEVAVRSTQTTAVDALIIT